MKVELTILLLSSMLRKMGEPVGTCADGGIHILC